MPLFAANYAEVTVGEQKPINLDRQRYAEFEAEGLLRLYTARTVTGQLIGYTQFILGRNLHHCEQRDAWHDATYLLPEYRGNRTGKTLLAFADLHLINDGADAIYQHVTPRGTHGAMLERMGYGVVETIYMRRIKESDHGRR